MSNTHEKSSFLPSLLFLLMGLVFFAIQISFGLRFLNRLWPDSLMTRLLVLAVFDLGALGWFLVWLTLAHGEQQRGVAETLFVLDLLAAGAVSLSEVFSAAAAWTDPVFILNLRTITTWILGVWVFLNLAAAYGFKFFSPGTQLAIRISAAKDEVMDSAVQMAEDMVRRDLPRLAGDLANVMYADAEHDLSVTARKALAKDDAGAALPSAMPSAMPVVISGTLGREASAPVQGANGKTAEPNPIPRQ